MQYIIRYIIKGTTIISASPAVSGTLNKGLNYIYPRWNNYFPTGSAIFNAIDLAEFAKEE